MVIIFVWHNIAQLITRLQTACKYVRLYVYIFIIFIHMNIFIYMTMTIVNIYK